MPTLLQLHPQLRRHNWSYIAEDPEPAMKYITQIIYYTPCKRSIILTNLVFDFSDNSLSPPVNSCW